MRNFALLSLLLLAGCVSCKSKHAKVDPRPYGIVRLHDAMTGQFFCSGAVIDEHWVVTAAHCLRGRNPVAPMVSVQSADGHTLAVAILALGDGGSDQGLLQGDFSAFAPLEAATDPATIVGSLHDTLIACGYPYAGELFCAPFVYNENYAFGFGGSGFLWPGMSGGPVIDTKTRKVIGVNTGVDGKQAVVSPLVNIFENLGIIRNSDF